MVIKLHKPLVVTFMKPLLFVMSMSINALVKKIITRHLTAMRGLTIIAQTQMATTQIFITTQVVEIQVAMAQMEGLSNQVLVEVVHTQRLFFPSPVAIHTKPIRIEAMEDDP